MSPNKKRLIKYPICSPFPIPIERIIPVNGRKIEMKVKKNIIPLTRSGAFFTFSTNVFSFILYCFI
jgi:hypothetical protein